MAFKALGWAIRYFMVMRDNYLGSYTNFSTLNEYLEKRKKGLPPGDPLELRYREGRVRLWLFRRYSTSLIKHFRLTPFKLKLAYF